jgi:hypothetical protein
MGKLSKAGLAVILKRPIIGFLATRYRFLAPFDCNSIKNKQVE